jgi:hypothetical protein
MDDIMTELLGDETKTEGWVSCLGYDINRFD